MSSALTLGAAVATEAFPEYLTDLGRYCIDGQPPPGRSTGQPVAVPDSVELGKKEKSLWKGLNRFDFPIIKGYGYRCGSECFSQTYAVCNRLLPESSYPI